MLVPRSAVEESVTAALEESSERWDVRIARRFVWEVRGSEGRGGAEEREVVEGRRERAGEVWVPWSRWKSSVGSLVMDEASSVSSLVAPDELGMPLGMVETMLLRRSFRASKCDWVCMAKSCRASVRLASMGAMRYLETP